MPSAEIITIGTEILLGEIVDTNSAYLARHLRDLNVDVFRTSTVGDNIQRIAAIIQETLERADIIITTGGLGPTVDDPTREAVALAFGVETEYRPELWEQIIERMKRFGRVPTENQKRQAYIPKGGIAIRNPVGTAPAFIMEQNGKFVFSLPGVPKEMEYLAENEVFPYLREKFQLRGTIKARVLHTAGMGESVIDEHIGELEQLSNPTVGLAAHYGQVDIRITAKADSIEEADRMIEKMEQAIREKLGKVVYGADDDRLEKVLMQQIAAQGLKLAAVEVNMGGQLIQKLSTSQQTDFLGGQLLPGLTDHQSLLELTKAEMLSKKASMALGVAAYPGSSQSDVDIVIITPEGVHQERRSYGGHHRNAISWGVNTALDCARNILIQRNP